MNRKVIVLIVVLIVAAVAWKPLSKLYEQIHVALPDYPQTKTTVWLDQKLSKQQSGWFYHADQGTRTFHMPYEWLAALERPVLSPLPWSTVGDFNDPAYLNRYGFIIDTIEPGKASLPIGFAHGGPMLQDSGEPWLNPQTRKAMTGIGLTCAACHTGSFTYKDKTVVIDGGPALIDLYKLTQGLGVALLFTRYAPGRFDRFADRVLGADASSDARTALKAQLDGVLRQYKAIKDLEDKAGGTYEGFGRLDALNRIGNQVFSLDLRDPQNYAAHAAPVHFPRIWDAPWFTWVQYDGSIMQPMIRNAGEAMGVTAELNLTNDKKPLFSSSVQVPTLYEMEQMITGNQPTAESGFTGLASPKWPKDILPAVDDKLAAEGATLYVRHCQGCHLPPVGTREFFESTRWLAPNAVGLRLLDLELIDLKHIGTDPGQAEGLATRKVAVPPNLGITTDKFGFALGEMVEKTVNAWYDSQKPPVPAPERERINGDRPNKIQAPAAYKVRPLNGIWATPPYLHNGSVPTIDALLSPVSERPTKFYLGNREYDAVKLGYHTEKLANGFEFDTSLPGNSNRGHEFNDNVGDGVIGRKLSPEERKALIEFIKTL
jgi:RoxA-like, cytochrome c-like